MSARDELMLDYLYSMANVEQENELAGFPFPLKPLAQWLYLAEQRAKEIEDIREHGLPQNRGVE